MPSSNKLPDIKDLKEGVHFYVEGPFLVFTEAYHLLKGFCCRNGCRHCPYTQRTEKK